MSSYKHDEVVLELFLPSETSVLEFKGKCALRKLTTRMKELIPHYPIKSISFDMSETGRCSNEAEDPVLLQNGSPSAIGTLVRNMFEQTAERVEETPFVLFEFTPNDVPMFSVVIPTVLAVSIVEE